MESKHTSGPWVAYTQLGKIKSIGKDGNGIICQCPTGNKRDVDNFQANAPLIMAAPELLEACKTVSQHIGMIGHPYGKKLKQAIAKAEGKELKYP